MNQEKDNQEEKLRQDFIDDIKQSSLDYYFNYFKQDAQKFYRVNYLNPDTK